VGSWEWIPELGLVWHPENNRNIHWLLRQIKRGEEQKEPLLRRCNQQQGNHFYTPCYLELCIQVASGNYKIHKKINNSSLPPAAHKKQMQLQTHLVSVSSFPVVPRLEQGIFE